MGLLDGKRAIVAGAGSGVGRASALRFSEEGASVVCADIDEASAGVTAKLIGDAGGRAVVVQTDVSREADVAAVVGAAVEAFGGLDIMFNNVGIPTPRIGATLTEHTMADFERLFAVNVGGVFLGSKHAVLRFREQGAGGVILNTGSVAGLVAWGGSVYGATKGAVHQLTRAVAIEGAPFGIRCNAICPAGMPYTNFAAAGGLEAHGAMLEQVAESVGAMHPLGRPILADDCAELAVFLVSDRAMNITGAMVPVDGGYTAR
jgi:NAD(P)-dependent dehydrogenase (short-subunit alcohol dehydrogenase family)